MRVPYRNLPVRVICYGRNPGLALVQLPHGEYGTLHYGPESHLLDIGDLLIARQHAEHLYNSRRDGTPRVLPFLNAVRIIERGPVRVG